MVSDKKLVLRVNARILSYPITGVQRYPRGPSGGAEQIGPCTQKNGKDSRAQHL